MSEYKVVEIDFKDEQVLIDSLKQMGYEPRVCDEAIPLEGYQGDKREQKAHIILPRKQVGSASNDVGFERTEDGFKLHVSQFDRAWRTGNKIIKLKQTYAEKKIRKTVSKKSKYTIKSRTEQEGKIKLKIKVLY